MHPTGSVTRQVRTKQVVLVAFLIELVVVVGLFNQGIAPHVQTYVQQNLNNFLGRAAYAFLNLSWRFTPLPSDTQHIWLSQLLGLLTLFVVTALLVLATVRGPITFLRALVSVWMSVIVAAGLAGYVRRLVVDGFSQRGTSRGTDAVFSVLSGFDFFLGILLGLVVGVAAGLAAVSTQRLTSTVTDAGAPMGAPMQQPPQMPVEGRPDQTAVFPRSDSGGRHGTPPSNPDPATAKFPRPPDETPR